MRFILLICAFLALPPRASSGLQIQDPVENPWKAFRFFAGEWEGHETGAAGTGQGSRSYAFILASPAILPQAWA